MIKNFEKKPENQKHTKESYYPTDKEIIKLEKAGYQVLFDEYGRFMGLGNIAEVAEREIRRRKKGKEKNKENK